MTNPTNTATAAVGKTASAAGFQPSGSATQNPDLPRVISPPLSRRPCFICYDTPFIANNRVHKAGVYYHGVKNTVGANGNEVEVPVNHWICSVLRVICIVRANAGNEHSYLVEYVPHGESSSHRMVLSQALLLGRTEELKVLRDHGVSILRSNMKHVQDYLDREHLRFSAQTPKDFWRSTKVIGWSPAPDCFVLPNETLGNHSRVWFSGKCEGDLYGKKEDLEKWKTNVAALCQNNPFLLFAVSSAFAGPLLEPCNIPGIGFHLYGDSTSGKTTVLCAASSVWAPPSFILSWRSTANGLEIQAASRSSTMIALDESHMIDPKALDSSVYLLANGVSKSRMAKDTSARELARWHLCVLSSGERSIESHLGAARIDHKVGQGIRIADVPVSGDHGLFNDLHGRKDGSVFSDELRNAAAKYYGHAGPLFVQRLIDTGPAAAPGSAIAELLPRFGEDLSAQEQRVARAFALVAFGGEFATSKGIVPWHEGDALTATVKIFALWRAAQPHSAKGKEHAQIIERIVDFVDRHGNARFLDINHVGSDLPTIRDQAGYWEDVWEDGPNHTKILYGRIYLFTPGGLREAAGNFGVTRVLAAIDAAKAFTQLGDGKKAKVRRVPEGGTNRL
jgi:putative DNA primase/helicase